MLTAMSVKDRLRFILIPLCFFGLYVLYSVLCASFFDDQVIAMVVADGVSAIGCVGVLLLLFKNLDFSPDERYRFSAIGLFICFVVFILLFVLSQGFAAGLRLLWPGTFVQIYDNLEGNQAVGFVFVGVVLSPICEELIFRGLLFRSISRASNKIIGFLVSTALFAMVHGTFIHIPVVVGVSILCIWMWELTGSFYWSIATHIVFNAFAVSFAVWDGLSYNAFVVCYYVLIVALLFSFMYMPQIREFLRKGKHMGIEEWVDKKRRELMYSRKD